MNTFAVLAQPQRRRILDALRADELSVNDLVIRLGLSQPAVSKHLRVLREAGLVRARTDARRRLYRVDPAPLLEIDAWLAAYRDHWSRGLEALRSHLDAEEGAMSDGTIERDGERVVFRYERRLDHPVETVWRAITTPAEIGRWMGVEVEEFDARPDGRIVLIHLGTHRVEDRVLKAEPPHLLQHTYFHEANPSAVVTWRLDAAGGGSTLTLTHALDMADVRAAAAGQGLDPVAILARNGAGWHHLLDMIALRLDGADTPTWSPEDRQALQKHYATLIP